MPYFDFSPPKKTERNSGSRRNGYGSVGTVIQKSVIGIVWITNKAYYYVKSNGHSYPIHPASYSCKGVGSVYQQCVKGRRLRFVRIKDEAVALDRKYLPFAPGCYVKGNLIQIGNKIHFKIHKVWVILEDKDCLAALDYYNNNLDEIKENYFKHEI